MMKREIRITKDGSHTVFVPEMNEAYHSSYGAIQESMHVFIGHGLKTIRKPQVRILEIGLGTGLNALLSLRESIRSGFSIYYHGVEKYPLERSEIERINYPSLVEGSSRSDFLLIHSAEWEEPVRIKECFTLFKEHADFREMDPEGQYDLVYYDAFDPRKQPCLWSEKIFSRIAGLVYPGGILVTYSAKGSVRRALINNGFQVKKLPGPPGKREMLRATRN